MAETPNSVLNVKKAKGVLGIPRSANFTQAEKGLLADLVDVYKDVLENKKTDAVMSKVLCTL